MGWAAGSEVARAMILAVSKDVPSPKARKRIYEALIEVLEQQDWDTQDEARDLDYVFDELLES